MGAVAMSLAQPSLGYGEPTTLESLMTPRRDEKSGLLAQGELLTTALKNARCEGNSVRLSTQSIGKIFNFHLSRAGDRYVYRLGKGRRIEELRYQREFHVYIAVFDAKTGQYTSRVVDLTPEMERHNVAELEDDGEIDVEQPRVIERQKNEVERDELESQDGVEGVQKWGSVSDDEFEKLERANPEDPVYPEDEVLAARISPDEMPMDNAREVSLEPTIDEGESPEMAERSDADDSSWGANLENAEMPEEQPVLHVPEPSTPVVLMPSSRRVVESEVLSSSGIAMFVLGFFMFSVAGFIYLLPAIQVRRRCRRHGIQILDMIRVASNQRIACVRVQSHTCLIAISPENMRYLAPCDEGACQCIRGKTYWHRMANHAMSDSQLVELVASLGEKNGTSEDKLEDVQQDTKFEQIENGNKEIE